MTTNEPILAVEGVAKSFVMHLRGGLTLPVVDHVAFTVSAGECVVLGGPSGAGKSSILKMVWGNYGVDAGSIRVRDCDGVVDVATAAPREILALRRSTMGYVSQFLRAVPRVSTLDVVMEPALAQGLDETTARARAAELLARLNVPERLWSLPPATFSGGEQQRVNIARGLISRVDLLLLDEPTASLDAVNRAVVVDLIEAKKAAGVAMLGIFHDADVRDRVASRIVDVTSFSSHEAAA
ncbi:MAG: phosphonate C-P lyase system protein PhnL [Hyphomicrobiales bacterium]|nr:phosphonate C-P lyase system protein PhnL [Hyphomicrobiales bacterium]